MPYPLKLFLLTVGSVVGVFGGLALLLALIAATNSRVSAYVVEKAATFAFGRDIAVEEVLVLEWGNPMTIEVTGLAVGNADWAEEPAILTAERLELAVAASGAFPPSFELPRLTVEGPAVFLAVNQQGQANWKGSAADSAGRSDGRAHLLGLEEFHLLNGRLVYRDANSGLMPMVRLNALTAKASGADQPIIFEGDGQLLTDGARSKAADIRFNGEAGSLQQLRSGMMPLRLDASVGSAHADVRGRITDLFGEASVDFRVNAEGKNLQPLLALAGVSVGSTPPFRTEAHLAYERARWMLGDVRARLGDTELNGTLTLDTVGPKPKIAGDLVAKLLASGQLRNIGQGAEQGGAEQKADGQARAGDAKGLPFELLEAANAELTLHAEQIQDPALPLRSASASVTLQDGALRIDPVKVEMAGGDATGSLRVDATAVPPVLTLKAEGKGLPVDLLPAIAGSVDGDVKGTVDLRSEGETVSALFSNLTGNLRAQVDGHVQEQPLHLELSAESAGSAAPVPVRLTGTIGSASLQATGDAQLRGPGARLVLDMSSSGPEVGALLAVAGIDHPPETPSYMIEGGIRYADKNLRLSDLRARLGDVRLNGTASADLSGTIPMVRADLSIPKLSWQGIERSVAESSSAASSASGGPSREQAIPPSSLPFHLLRSADAEVTIDIAETVGVAFPVGAVRLDAHLRDGKLRLEPLRVDMAGGSIGGTVTADGKASPPTVGASLDLDAISMDAVMAAMEVSKRVKGRVNGTVALQSAGTTLQAHSETLDGRVRVYVTDGQFSTRLIDAMAANIGEAFSFLFTEGEVRPVDCIVGRFDVENGTVDPETMVFVTEDMVLRGSGRVDLAEERIDLTLTPRPKERHLLDITVPVKATGSLADPKFDIGVTLWSKLAKERVCERTLSGQDESQAQR
ncbi:AsmA family protein [Azospirillum sp. SYSU D00513]|uniref:AsmA family protein n=1 Tax=Azospirillum sp. SYSU D00513 TaxID=2812561 RepID=UPI001A9780DE|nr:AsmA family protein [Azospirillum sp. SYSU D00513]